MLRPYQCFALYRRQIRRQQEFMFSKSALYHLPPFGNRQHIFVSVQIYDMAKHYSYVVKETETERDKTLNYIDYTGEILTLI